MTTGILGGTFDPPQVGHVALGRAADRSLRITSATIRSSPSVGRHPVSAWIFEMSGTRLSMSSKPSSYASS